MSETEERAVLATVQRMTSAFHAGDVPAILETYAPEATVVFEPGAALSEADAIREAFTAASAMQPRFTYSGHEVFVQGDVALHLAPWRMRAETPQGAVEQRGLSIAVLCRQADGAWKLVLDDPHGQHLVDSVGYPD